MAHRIISATEFKAKCLALLDEVEETGNSITVTKRGRAVAKVERVAQKPWKSPRNMFKGKIEIIGDIVNTDFEWNCVKEDELI